MSAFSVSAGGICFKDNQVLLVKIEYGANRGMWMIPGGMVELGESIEEATVREFREETGLETEIVRMVCLRSGTQERNGVLLTSIYVVFEVKYRSGMVMRDELEIADLRFWHIDEVMKSDVVIELTKEMIKAACGTRNGLYRGDEIRTKSEYNHTTIIFLT
ncbi:NUDIX domain-containing protein [Paenibacillus sp. EC2-1]|uniref:NUDIX domain-containing protein n=1 Tax=Paenibacillus sp. EC2-1 TaxID=3388665 RepID=UPI003BEF0FDF